MVQIHAHTKLMMLIRYICSSYSLSLSLCFSFFLVKAALASHCCYSFWASVCFASLCFYSMQCITFFLFCSATFVSLLFKKRLTEEQARANDARISHSIELNEMCVDSFIFFFSSHIEIACRRTNVCINVKRAEQ